MSRTMRYGLTQLFHGTPSFLELTHEHFCRVVAARQGVVELLQIEETFVYLIENYRDLEADALANTLRNANFPSRPWSEMISDIHLFNRRIINLLTTCRLYLDHTPHRITAAVPDDDTLRSAMKRCWSKRYEASFAYRLAEELRNYVQHRGLPLSGVRRGGRVVDPSFPQAGSEHTLEFNIDRDRLIEDPKFKARVADELRDIDGRVDIRPMIREYVTLLADSHQELRSMVDAAFAAADNTVSDAINQYSQGDESREVALYAVEENEHQQVVQKVYLSRDPAKRYRDLVGRYSHLSAIARQYITSAPPKA